jgi:hypothetical protein
MYYDVFNPQISVNGAHPLQGVPKSQESKDIYTSEVPTVSSGMLFAS